MATHLTKEMRPVNSLLKKNGYVQVRSKGSHFIYFNRTTHRHITVNKNIDWVVLLRLIKENEINVDKTQVQRN